MTLKTRKYLSLFSAAALWLIGNLYVIWHLSREHYIYFWDISGYWVAAMDWKSLFITQPLQAMSELYNSILHADYNLLPALPVAIAFLLRSASRKVYTLAIYNLYVLPFIGLMLFLLYKLRREEDTHSGKWLDLGAAALFLLAFPALLTPMLAGYLDAAGLPVIVLILILLFRSGFSKISSRDAGFLVLLLVLLSLIRRWYLFWVTGFFVAAGVVYGAKWIARRWKNAREIMNELAMLAAVGLGYLLILWIFFYGFLYRVLHNHFTQMYRAYDGGGLLHDLSSLVHFFGGGILILALIGAALMLANKKSRYFALFLTVQSVVIFLLFTHVQSFGSQHIYLFVPAIGLFATFGLTDGIRRISQGWLRSASYAAALCLITVNFCYAYIGDTPVSKVLRPVLTGETMRPRTRGDIPEMKKLASYLTSLTRGTSKTVYVAASSFVLNDEILANADLPAIHYAVEGLVFSHHVDLRDGFPNQFLLADYIVAANPVQYHLNPVNQQVVGIPAELALSGRCSNLKPLRTFALDKGVTATVYQRVGAYPKECLDQTAQTLRSSYPNQPSLRSVNYFYGLVQNIRAPRPDSQLYYQPDGSLLLNVSPHKTLQFELNAANAYQFLSFRTMCENQEDITVTLRSDNAPAICASFGGSTSVSLTGVKLLQFSIRNTSSEPICLTLKNLSLQ